jgi:hypothetical protein
MVIREVEYSISEEISPFHRGGKKALVLLEQSYASVNRRNDGVYANRAVVSPGSRFNGGAFT